MAYRATTISFEPAGIGDFRHAPTHPVQAVTGSKPILKHSQGNSGSREPSSRLIYVVDDTPQIAELYTLALEPAGCSVRAFSHRSKALSALKNERQEPELLITDYLGLGMPVELFLALCLRLHPGLRILMATGFLEVEPGFLSVKPHCFLRKPFTMEEFKQAVSAALVFKGSFS